MALSMRSIGALLVIFGIVDLVGAFFLEFDVWYELGVELPDTLWSFSAWIEIGLGCFLYKMGGGRGN